MSGVVVLDSEALLPDGGLLLNVHSSRVCAGRPCVVHDPSDHPMREWPLRWRNDRRMFVRLCEHADEHPDPDDLTYRRAAGLRMGVHSCDGCCAPPAVSA